MKTAKIAQNTSGSDHSIRTRARRVRAPALTHAGWAVQVVGIHSRYGARRPTRGEKNLYCKSSGEGGNPEHLAAATTTSSGRVPRMSREQTTSCGAVALCGLTSSAGERREVYMRRRGGESSLAACTRCSALQADKKRKELPIHTAVTSDVRWLACALVVRFLLGNS